MIEAVAAAVARLAEGDGNPVERRDTHLSVVFLHGDRAYKVERAIAFPFVDHRALAARRRSQEAALERNHALAADIYLRVLSVVPDGDGFRFAPDDDPAAVEYVLEMRRFDPRHTLAERLDAGGVTDREIDRIARRLSLFHEAARRVTVPTQPSPAVARIARTIDANLDELLGDMPGPGDRAAIHRVRRRLLAALRDHAAVFAARNRDGWVRDLHGDLRADHVLVADDRIRVVDAIEFSRELAEIDVADELAFLTGDLEARGERQVATQLLDAYRAHGGDPGPAPLRAFYETHRVCVRAKVVLLAGPGDADEPLAEARRLLALAERLSWRVPGPRAYVVCGPSGSGKSRLADALAARAGMTVLAADRVRKQRAGLPATARAPDRLYAPSVSEETYRELGERATRILDAGDSVVIDATCLNRSHRATLRSALGGRSRRVWFVRCEAPTDVLRQRIERRTREPDRVSDATVDVLEKQLAAVEPLDEVPADRVLPLRTDMPVDQVLDRLSAMLDA